jgi:Xaa-Pro aminopeptidase
MSEPLLLRAAPGRSADLFHALPLDIIDPFLYIELDDRRFAVNSVLERDRIEALGLGIELTYRPGFGGCRLEDLVLVTEDGCEVLTDFPYDLEP